MGLFSIVTGNAEEINTDELNEEFEYVLAEDEEIIAAFKLVRDLIVFTPKRVILVDKQGITGKKREYHSILYKAIYEFKVETSGHFNDDSELKIYTSIHGASNPIELEFVNGDAIVEVQKILAKYVG